MTDPATPPPDDKDWTWTLQRPCPDCGFDAATISRGDVPALTRTHAAAMVTALGEPDADIRPEPTTWSTLEYACHVRDVCVRFDERLTLMLDEDDPQFPNWDQDETAVTARYWEQDAVTVAAELASVADSLAGRFAAVENDQWSRPGRRSNGSLFTVDSLARYFLHDLAHHARDVRR